MASRANVYIDQGTDFRISIELSDEQGAALSMANYDFYSTIRKMYNTNKIADFIIQKDAPNSTITLTLPDNITQSMKPGKYQYDVLMRKTTGEMVKVVEGIAIVLESTTNVLDLSAGQLQGGEIDGLSDGDNLDGGQY